MSELFRMPQFLNLNMFFMLTLFCKFKNMFAFTARTADPNSSAIPQYVGLGSFTNMLYLLGPKILNGLYKIINLSVYP